MDQVGAIICNNSISSETTMLYFLPPFYLAVLVLSTLFIINQLWICLGFLLSFQDKWHSWLEFFSLILLILICYTLGMWNKYSVQNQKSLNVIMFFKFLAVTVFLSLHEVAVDVWPSILPLLWSSSQMANKDHCLSVTLFSPEIWNISKSGSLFEWTFKVMESFRLQLAAIAIVLKSCYNSFVV